ncbi:MAG: TonB-dependent siderophore receptor [Thalassobaculaceae bacterium]|nr:TonB-dependent siderophore receptor [Thalassobaculaceae bacterium]
MAGASLNGTRAALLMAAATLLAPTAGRAEDKALVLPTVRVEGAVERNSTRDEVYTGTATSATKTNTPTLETPQAVTTITRKQLDDQNPQTVRGALNYTPGVLSGVEATTRYDSVFMRGFGGFGLSTDVVDFLDGLKLPRGQAFALPSVDPFLLDRVEVLRGPAAVLYGQTTPGGLVNQVSRSPDATPYNEARIEAGNHDRLQAGVTSQGPIDADGRWQYSLSGIGRYAGTRYEDVDDERVALSPAVTWRPTEDTALSLRGFYQNDPEGGYFNSIYPGSLAAAPYGSYLDRDFNVGDPKFDSYEREQYGVGYSLDHRFNDVISIGSKLRYSAIDLDFRGIQMAGAVTDDGIMPRQAVRSIEDVGGVAMDNHGQFDFNTGPVEHTGLLGFDLQNSESTWEYQFGAASSLDVTNPQYGGAVGPLATFIDNEQTLQQTGVYAQDQVSFGGFHVVLGARYDWTEQETENRLSGTTSSQSSDSASYRAGLLYKFDNGLAPYASYSTSFEPTIGVDVNGDAFKPTEADQWEIGLKYEPSFMDALFAVSAFEIVQENVLTPDTTLGFSVQQGEVRSRGLEFEARGNVTADLELIGALTLLDTEVTESTVSTTLGKRPQAAPEYFGSAWANYTVGFGSLDGLTIGAGLRFVGSSYADDANTVSASGYTLVDAALRYDLEKALPALGGAEATLDVTNLFDKEYYASCSSNFFCQYGNGTQVLVGLRYRW